MNSKLIALAISFEICRFNYANGVVSDTKGSFCVTYFRVGGGSSTRCELGTLLCESCGREVWMDYYRW